jgi:general secretion pathway protein G
MKPVLIERRNSRKILVRDFQKRFLLVNVFFIGLASLAFVAALYGPLVLALFDPNASREESAAAATTFLVLHGRIWLAMGLVLLAGAWHLTVLSHRVAGPLLRLSGIFRKAGRGDVSMRVRVRRRDYLQDEAEALDYMMMGLRRRFVVAKGRLTRIEAALEKVQSSNATRPGQEAASTLCELQQEVRLLRRCLDRCRTVPEAKPGSTAPSGIKPANDLPSPPGRVSERDSTRPRRVANGFTLIELLIAVAIFATLSALIAPVYGGALNRSRVVRASVELRSIGSDIKIYQIANKQLPDTLVQAGVTALNDPWGAPYQYLKIRGAAPAVLGAVRKDRKLNPINSDYDLYSKGRDGSTRPPIAAAESEDDIIRANDGGYVGLASEF